MQEAHANYSLFPSIARAVGVERGLEAISERLSTEDKFRHLFLQGADHPMGYADGASGVQYAKLARRTRPLSKEDCQDMLTFAESTLNYRNENTNLSIGQPRELLLVANQLIQPVLYKDSWGEEATRAKKLSERITRDYTSSSVSIKEWDAQFAENRGFWHREKANNAFETLGIVGDAAAAFATYACIKHFATPEVMDVIENTMMGSLMGFGAYATFGNKIMVAIQDFTNKKGSPNTAEKLVTDRHYGFVRHPLYSADTFANMAYGVGMLNPFTLGRKIKQTFHNLRACEEQDSRMRILFGESARDYQEQVPGLVPGANIVRNGLRKILPEKVMHVLEQPVTKYLGKIPYVRSEPAEQDSSYKGSPTTHMWFSFETPWKQNLSSIGNAMGTSWLGMVQLPLYYATKGKHGMWAKKLVKEVIEPIFPKSSEKA